MMMRTPHNGAHILLVEDCAFNREIALELLNAIGLAVDTAENGLEAVNMTQHNSYDLILMDVQMPVMDGVDATRVIRTKHNATELPILAISASIVDDERESCLNAGMNDFITKPFELDKLYSTITKWLPEQSGSRAGGRPGGED